MKILRLGPGAVPDNVPVYITCHDCLSFLEITARDTLRVVYSKGTTSHVIKCGNCNYELWINAIRFKC